MNIQIAKNRIYQVINVDSINNEEYDFMATHIPFKKIVFQGGVLLDKNQENIVKKEILPETDVFYKLFEDDAVRDKHQLIIVNGSSGSGKSHFIRWVYTNLLAKKFNNGEDEVLLINRSDNTLKGTIKQLLGIEAVKNLRNRDIYERLVKANTTISDVKFKEEIFAKFIVEINVSDDEFLTSLAKKRLVALLNNDLFKSEMMKPDGPIERIFSKISASNVSNIDIIAEFKKEDFIITTDFFDEMKDTADNSAVSMAKKLVSDDCDDELLSKIVNFMNSKVDDVIQSCAGIEPGDFQQIFKEIRQELYKQGKNLILLIEDITSFTGVNQALLNVLVTEHTGLNASDKLCKLVSVVGATKQYYDTFRDNYKDRITAQITIEDGSLGQNKNDLFLFFAKYLNAVSLLEKDFKEWYVNTGADEAQIPVHIPDVASWETVQYSGNNLSLYPFTKKAIENLYAYMNVHQTPRYILLEIIKPAIVELITDKSKFITYLVKRNKPDLGDAVLKISAIVNTLKIDNREEYKERAIALISFWGNGELKKVGNKIAGISKDIFIEFGFSDLWNSLINTIDEGVEGVEHIDSPEAVNVPDKPVVVQTNKAFEKFKSMLDNWYYKKAVFVEPRAIKEELSDFIYNTINWQQYGIPKNRIKTIWESGFKSKMISFERQEKGAEDGLIRLDDSMETYTVLRSIGQWIYLGGKKSWDFDGAYNAVFILTNWLESRKKEIISIVKDYKDDDVPNYVKLSLVSLVYEKILKKQINYDKVEEITIQDIISSPAQTNIGISKNEKWNKLLEFIKSSVINVYNIVIEYFNISQGEGQGKKFLDYYLLEKTLNNIKKSKFVLPEECFERSKYVRERDILDYYLKLVKFIPAIVSDEEIFINDTIGNIYKMFDLELSDEISTTDLKELLDEVTDFYKKAEQNGFLLNQKVSVTENYKKEAANISKNIFKLMKKEQASDMEKLLGYSCSDVDLLIDFSGFLNNINQDVERIHPQLESEMDALTKQGRWVEDDPRFAQNEVIKNMCVEVMEG